MRLLTAGLLVRVQPGELAILPLNSVAFLLTQIPEMYECAEALGEVSGGRWREAVLDAQ